MTLVIPVIPVMDSRYACYILLLWPLGELPQMLSSGFISDFQFYDYVIPVHTCYTCILTLLSPVLIWSYHEYFLPDIICYISTCLCMLLLTAQFSIHDYDSVLSIHMCLSLLATWLLHHHSPGEFHLTPLDPHVQVLELGACGFSQLLIRVAQR